MLYYMLQFKLNRMEMIKMTNKTYKDFGEAIEELRQNSRISYDTIAFGMQRAQSYVYGICTRRVRRLPEYEQIKEFADFFHVEPEYFYEYRLRRMLDFIDKNREFLDHCEREKNKWLKREELKPDIEKTETIKKTRLSDQVEEETA